MTPALILLALALLATLTFLGRPYWAWVSAAIASLIAWRLTLPEPTSAFCLTFAALFVLAVLTGVKPVRRWLLSSWLMRIAAKSLPTIGDTERIALEAGSVWFEGELFSGKPNWQRLMDFRVKPLNTMERDFLEGPVEDLCAMLEDEANYKRNDLSPEVWAFIKEKKFLGMIIPREYGGLGFSAAGHAAVVTKLASRSLPAAITVMVPNSLGPGELLMRYGTKAQQQHYLPRLATGDEVPCFALTEPTAGSDAANGQSFGVVTKGTWQGQEMLGIKLTFNKRYITLAPVATVVGLAFKLFDPEHLLGEKEDLGITCALLPRSTPGLNIGNRHDPLGVPFMNGPLNGKDVFVPLDVIIGGPEYAGQGWRMLMECLAAGRAISLPSLSVGGAQLSTRATSAYAVVREQFGLSIGKFEGIRERLARIATLTYVMNATRRVTCGAIDDGEHPAVASAISKYHLTEGLRTTINDAVDITGGSSICRGPRNIFARVYGSIPIAITVEGANILTRSLIVFGQGAMRCHPWLQKEVDAITKRDVKGFDQAFFKHIAHVATNAARALALAFVPARTPIAKLTRYSAAFAFLADVGLITLGGALKRKEYLSGRYADAFAWLYMAAATLKHHHDAAAPKAHAIAVQAVLTLAYVEIENALAGVLRNLPNRPCAFLARLVVFPLGRWARPFTDRQTDKLVNTLLDEKSGLRDFLTPDLFIPAGDVPGMGKLEDAYQQLLAIAPVREKVVAAVRAKQLPKSPVEEMLRQALEKGILTSVERGQLMAAEAARLDAIQVDHYQPGHTTEAPQTASAAPRKKVPATK